MRNVRDELRKFILTVVIGGVAVGLCLAALLPGLATVGGAQHFNGDKLGTLHDLKQRSTLYDAGGNVIGVLGLQNREDAKFAHIPKVIRQAVISVEDRTFWTNDGIDLNSTLRAFLRNLSSGAIEEGGSTITQQLVKNRILTNKRDVNRKVREIILALRLNNKYSKREILEQYLNTVYFGQGSYGVKSAVERYFLTADPGAALPRSKHLSEVTIGEAALLAGLISNPEGNNPFTNPDGARQATRRGARGHGAPALHHPRAGGEGAARSRSRPSSPSRSSDRATRGPRRFRTGCSPTRSTTCSVPPRRSARTRFSAAG